MTTIKTGKYPAKVALPRGENRLPRFRSPNHDTSVTSYPDVPEKYTRLMGLDCGTRVLPYTMLDTYDRNLTDQELPAIIMENDYLRATFLPTLGCRLISLVDKTTHDKELLFNNTAIQVANLSTRDAWFAGGIEWNIGQYGHAFSSMDKIYVSSQTGSDKQEFLRIYDYERCKGVWWHIDFHLADNTPLLYAHVTVHNLYDEPTSMYYWTNSAVYMTETTRVFSSGNTALYLDPYAPPSSRKYGYMKMPTVPLYPDLDASYPQRFPYSDEYFFLCDQDVMPWEAAFDVNAGTGFFEVSNHPLSYRKMFCWGHGQGGRHWQRFLAPDKNTEYVEIQAGLAPSQTHGLYLDAHSTMSWTQAFGPVTTDSQDLQKTYDLAVSKVAERVEGRVNADLLEKMDYLFSDDAERKPENIIQEGNGWGYLEQKLRGIVLPSAFSFTPDSVGNAEKPWNFFLDNGYLPIVNETSYAFPVVVNNAWKQRLEEAIEKYDSPHDQTRGVMLHYLGTTLLEGEDVVAAKQCWLDAYAIDPNPWTARNIAVLELRRNAVDIAFEWYEKAVSMDAGPLSIKIAEEYFHALVENGRVQEAETYFNTLPASYLEESDALALDRAKLAAMLGDPTKIKELAIDRVLCNIREGDTPLDALWEQYCIMAKGRIDPLPAELDFNLYR